MPWPTTARMSRATCAACRSWRPRTTPASPPERSKSLRSVFPKLGPLETSSGLFLSLDRPSPRSRATGSALRRGGMRHPSLHHLDGERKHDGRAALARDIEQGREITQLHRLRHRRQDLGGVEQLLRRLLLSLGVDDLGAAGAFGLGLAGDRADHALVEIDALDLHGRDLDTPPLGLLVEHVLDVGIELVALGQHLVEIVLAEHPAQRGLRKLAGGGEIVVDLNHRALGIDDAEIDHGVDFDRHVVARNHVLGRHLVDDHAKIDPHHLLHQRHEQEEPRSLGAGVTPEGEHDAALVFAQDPDRREQDDHDEDRQKGDGGEGKHWSSSLWSVGDRQAGSTTRTRPSRLMTLMRAPGCSGRRARARQISPLTRTLPSSPSHATVSPSVPSSPSLPVTTGRRHDRSSIVRTSRNSAAVVAVAAATTESERVRPGAPGGNIMIAPITNATIPPTPMTPKEPIWASATMRAIPSSTSAAPA